MSSTSIVRTFGGLRTNYCFLAGSCGNTRTDIGPSIPWKTLRRYSPKSTHAPRRIYMPSLLSASPSPRSQTVLTIVNSRGQHECPVEGHHRHGARRPCVASRSSLHPRQPRAVLHRPRYVAQRTYVPIPGYQRPRCRVGQRTGNGEQSKSRKEELERTWKWETERNETSWEIWAKFRKWIPARPRRAHLSSSSGIKSSARTRDGSGNGESRSCQHQSHHPGRRRIDG